MAGIAGLAILSRSSVPHPVRHALLCGADDLADVVAVSESKPIQDALELDAWLAALLGIVAAFALTFAFLAARTTIYTITTRRAVLRYGIAFTKAVNVPLRLVKSANPQALGCTRTARETLRSR